MLWLAFVMAKDFNTLVAVYLAIDVLGMAVALIGLVRSARIGFTLDDKGLTVRTTYATRSWPWKDIASARTLDRVSRGGTLGLFGGSVRSPEQAIQMLPTITLVSGDVIRFYALRMTVRTTYATTWVDDALIAVTRRAQAFHGTGEDTPPTRERDY
jgi:hypothetical protein